MRQPVLPQVSACFWLHRAVLTLLVWGLLAGLSLPTHAQAPPPNAKKNTSKPATNTKGTKQTQPATPPPKATDPDIDPATQLPKDYKIPPDKPDVLTSHESLLTPQELADLKKNERRYKTLVLGGSVQLKDDEKAAIRKGIQYRLALLCEKDNLQTLHMKREDLTVRDQQTFGRLAPAADVRSFRKFILAEILKQTEPLLKKNSYVRIQAATLIGELDLTETDAQRNLKLEAFVDGIPVLAKVINDPEQPEPVKISAARSIVRLLRHGVPNVQQKHEVANAIVAELKDEKKFFWYQLRLVEALALLDVVLDLQNRKPFIVDTLRMVMNDPKRDWQVRAMAARSLGRVPFDPSISIPAVMFEIAQFGHEMAKAAQQQPKNAQWKTNFWWLYLAFVAQDANDLDATRKLKGGLRNNPATASACEPVYQLVHPITNALLNGQPVTVPMVKALDDWLQKNKQANQGNMANKQAAGGAPNMP